MCGVATSVCVPAAAAARARAIAPSMSSGPSSMPGRRWQCRSITGSYDARLKCGRPSGGRRLDRCLERRRMFGSIVVGTDGSGTAKEAVRQAIDLAKQVGASLDIVSAYEPVAGDRLRQEQREAPKDVEWA